MVLFLIKVIPKNVIRFYSPNFSTGTTIFDAIASMNELEAEGLLAKRQLPLALSATAKAFDDYVQSESKRWEKIIRDNKVAIE